MGRAPNAGAPQRVSAHVVPKAAAYGQSGRADPEEEKTTIESGWEDEASTTVEQGEVAEKIRALAPVLEARRKEAAAPDAADTPLRKGGTGITSTNGASIIDEPTVDDQRANALISLMMPPSSGRLVVTMGNDSGTTLEVRPGKSYTIGRGLDNDIVLTDIAVSRKHFDLRHEAGAWVLVDRGSGNGTLVNGVFEDQPFVLANGDTIEIGNTSFRFEMQGARAPEPMRPSMTEGLDVDLEDNDEPSTVAGKVPIRGEDIPTPLVVSKSSPVSAQRPRVDRPKTAPPPPPLPRPRTQSNVPSMSAAYSSQHAVPSVPVGASAVMSSMSASMAAMNMSITPGTAAMPQSTMPLPQMAGRMPMGHGSGMGPAVEPLVIGIPGQIPLNTTLPGQGIHHYQPNGLAPNMAMAPTLIPPPGTPMGSMPPGPTSQPYDYYSNGTGPGYAQPPGSNPMFHQQPPPQSAPNMNGMWGPPQYQHMGPQSGIEIAPGIPGRDATTTGLVPPHSYAPLAYGTPHQGTPALSRRAKLVLGGALLSVVAALATVAIIKSTSHKGQATTAAKIEEPKADGKDVKALAPPVKPPAAPPGKQTPPPPVKPTQTVKQQPVVTPTPPPVKQTPVVTPPPVKQTPATIATQPAATPPTKAPTTNTPPIKAPTIATAPPSEDKPGQESKAEKKKREKAEKAERARIAKDKRDQERREKRERDKKAQAQQVAIDTQIDSIEETPTSSVSPGAKEKAEELYKKKKFNEAAAAIKAGAKTDPALKKLFTAYEQVGRAYPIGMSANTKPVEAYRSLKRARSFDATAGGYHEDEINTKLSDVATKAAVKLLGDKDYAEAYSAMNLAESVGVKSPTLKLVRNKLETAAGVLYGQAESEMAANPDEAKKKLRLIKIMVSADSPWAAKATKLLRS